MNILITGASRGIGFATARQFDQPGNNLFLVATAKGSFKQEFKHAGIHTFGVDPTNPEAIARLAAELAAEADQLDLLINNAGVMIMKKFEQLKTSEINLMLHLNLRAYMLVTHALLPLLRKSARPHIIFMSSMGAKSSIIGESVYDAAKSGVTNFANVLRNELGPNIRVSAVHAWGVDTWGAPNSSEFIQPADIAVTMEFIATRPDTVMVESIELGNVAQWRGGQAPWSPQN